MATEIERKFLVTSDAWRSSVTSSTEMRQAYLAADGPASVRVRIKNGKAMLTVKGAQAGLTRSEFEYPIPIEDGEAMMGLRTGRVIAKRRHIVPVGPRRWEIDVFSGELDGLVIAEIELASETEEIERPEWLGEEVTSDPRYYNANLAAAPRPGDAGAARPNRSEGQGPG